MRRRTWLVAGIVVAVGSVVVVGALVIPRSFAERAAISLYGAHSPPWQQGYCVPPGTLVTFAWQTSDGSAMSLRLWSSGLTLPPPGFQYNHFGNNGGGAFYFYPVKYFQGADTTASQVQIEIALSFSVNGSLLSGPAAFGPC